MTTIIGIDYSGDKRDRNTWVAQGSLDKRGVLILHGAEMTRRKDVIKLLSTASTPAIAAIDFPFCVPQKFAEYLNSGGKLNAMPDMWRIAASMSLDDFKDKCADFGQPKLKRAGDETHFRESFSPLNSAQPDMRPMTFRGMKMLHDLHRQYPTRWIVPPLQTASDVPDAAVTLLETMPGAFLNAIGFEHAVYKRYKKARNALQNRRIILDGLSDKSGIDLPNIADLREDCLASDDCLDSVIAAVAAVSWAQNATRFRHPNRDELPSAKLEGWIYVPKN